MWPEVDKAKSEERREIVLSGLEISKRILEKGLDPSIYTLTELNFLSLTDTCLSEIPEDLTNLRNLQILILHSNKIKSCLQNLDKLSKLKILDISRNMLEELPNSLGNLPNIVTLNFANNKLERLPPLSKNTKLSVLDLSNNNLAAFPDICSEELANLSELKLPGNQIPEIPNNISVLPSLKIFDISENKIKSLPGELANCSKLKEINLKENPIIDRRLLKLIEQCRTKQIIDYVKQHCPKTSTVENIAIKKGKKGKGRKQSEDSEDLDIEYKYTITVKPAPNDLTVVVKNSVISIREHIVCCIIDDVTFTEESFKKFIQLQNKLHDGICDKRNAATIATHDLKKLGSGVILYTTFPPKEFKIKPLNRPVEMTGSELFLRLQTEANNLRKEKKRSTYSGIHKYLYLIEGKPEYPCLQNDKGEVISFPPITNSDITKIEPSTKQMFVEVTSTVSQFVCKNALTELLKQSANLLEKDLNVQQVKIFGQDEKLKVVFPSKIDLKFGKDSLIKCRYLENTG